MKTHKHHTARSLKPKRLKLLCLYSDDECKYFISGSSRVIVVVVVKLNTAIRKLTKNHKQLSPQLFTARFVKTVHFGYCFLSFSISSHFQARNSQSEISSSFMLESQAATTNQKANSKLHLHHTWDNWKTSLKWDKLHMSQDQNLKLFFLTFVFVRSNIGPWI